MPSSRRSRRAPCRRRGVEHGDGEDVKVVTGMERRGAGTSRRGGGVSRRGEARVACSWRGIAMPCGRQFAVGEEGGADERK